MRRLRGKKQQNNRVSGIDAEFLNDHYCKISTHHCYTAPPLKQTATNLDTDWRVFKILDNLRPTATDFDDLPAWFLRLGAPIFCRPLSHLFNFSLSTSTVPHQSKQAWIRPVPKISDPVHATCRFSPDFHYSSLD